METERQVGGTRPPRGPDDSPYLTTKQAARYLGFSARTLEAMRRKGEGPPFRYHGNRIRYHIDDLDAWSAARLHRKPPPRTHVDDKQGELPLERDDDDDPHPTPPHTPPKKNGRRH